MNGNEEELRLLESIGTVLGHIKDEIKNTNLKLDTLIAGQIATNSKLDQIITNTTPTPSDDITSLGGSISTPTKRP